MGRYEFCVQRRLNLQFCNEARLSIILVFRITLSFLPIYIQAIHMNINNIRKKINKRGKGRQKNMKKERRREEGEKEKEK